MQDMTEEFPMCCVRCHEEFKSFVEFVRHICLKLPGIRHYRMRKVVQTPEL